MPRQITDMLNEIYFDELNHVTELRSLLGILAVPRPAINLAALGAITATNALSIARLFEDVGVTAYAGALAALSGQQPHLRLPDPRRRKLSLRRPPPGHHPPERRNSGH